MFHSYSVGVFFLFIDQSLALLTLSHKRRTLEIFNKGLHPRLICSLLLKHVVLGLNLYFAYLTCASAFSAYKGCLLDSSFPLNWRLSWLKSKSIRQPDVRARWRDEAAGTPYVWHVEELCSRCHCVPPHNPHPVSPVQLVFAPTVLICLANDCLSIRYRPNKRGGVHYILGP